MKNLIVKAIDATKTVVPGYFENTCRQRLAGGAGSCYDNYRTIEELEAALRAADWQPAEHPSVAPGCTAYKTTDLKGGRFGLVAIAGLPDDAEIIASDPKGTGRVSMTVKGQLGAPVAETWLIVGDEDGHQVVFTFHPGKPVAPSIVAVENCPDGTVLTKAQALELGFDLAKIVG